MPGTQCGSGLVSVLGRVLVVSVDWVLLCVVAPLEQSMETKQGVLLGVANTVQTFEGDLRSKCAVRGEPGYHNSLVVSKGVLTTASEGHGKQQTSRLQAALNDMPQHILEFFFFFFFSFRVMARTH